MALRVAADTARAQIAAVVQQAEDCISNFASFVAEKPASSLSKIDRTKRTSEILDRHSECSTAFVEISKQYKAIRERSEHLPEWNGIGDQNALSTLYANNEDRIKRCFKTMIEINKKFMADFYEFYPQDNVPFNTETALSL